MRQAKAFVFAPEEDFGITPVEAQAAGTPVIAYGAGGVLETVRGLDQAKPTGLFFDAQTPEALQRAVQRFEQESALITGANCRANAERFATSLFQSRYTQFVAKAWRSRGGTIEGLEKPKVA